MRLLLLLAVIAACGPKVDVTPLRDLSLEPISAEVAVFLSPERVDRPYEDLAIISIDDEGWDREDSELIERMKQEARKLGADGIVLLNQERTEGGGVFVGNVWVTSEHKVIRALAIRFTESAN